jgi:hypothetical protein
MRRLSLLVVLAALSTSCAEDELSEVPPDSDELDTHEVPETCQTGILNGHICAYDSDPLEGAYIWISATDCYGVTQRFEAYTGDNGAFVLPNLPAGNHILVIEHAALDQTIPVTVLAGDVVTVSRDGDGELLCDEEPPPRIAVITGEWDEVQVLLDGLEIPYDTFEGTWDPFSGSGSEAKALLEDFARLSEYDAVFVNCGRMDRDFLASSMGGSFFDPTMIFDYNATSFQNLRQFVANGGSIYASDWSWPIAEGLKADVINFYGEEGSDGYNVTKGVEGDLTGQLMDPGLESFLASSTVELSYDLSSWAIIDGVSTAADIYVLGNPPIYTSDDMSTTGQLNSKPLLVGFRPFAGGGYAIYTTFHYHSQPSEEMLDVLRYLIFQL